MLQTLKKFRWAIFAVVCTVILVAGYLYWRHGKYYPTTDDAYVNAHVVRVATEVSGAVARVRVRDQQYVHKGEALFDIDRRPFELALNQANANLANVEQQVRADRAALEAAQADVANQEIALKNADDNAERVRGLRAEGFVSAQAYDNTAAAAKAAHAQLRAAIAHREQARNTVADVDGRNGRIRQAEATAAQARLNLAHTHLAAACDGRIAQLSLRPGDWAMAGNSLFALVCDNDYWIDANFKETQLARITPGQRVDIDVDMYPGHHFRGRVENIGGASGTAFSLLPPQNATGNWVKVTQRVPVRIVVLDADSRLPLRVGTSAVVTVDTTEADEGS